MGNPSRHIVYNEIYREEAIEYRNYLLLLGYGKETCQTRYLWLKEFFSWLEGIGVYEISLVGLEEMNCFFKYLESRKSSKTFNVLGKKTVYDMIRNLQRYFSYLQKLGKVKINPSSHLKVTYTEEQVERYVFTQDQIRSLYQLANNQERMILNIAYGCGLRVNEISRLNKEDIRLTENILIVQKGKNNKRRLVPITDQIRAELEDFIFHSQDIYFSNEENTDALFINIKGRRMQEWTLNSTLKQLIKRTEFGKRLDSRQLNKIGIHTLRHSIATHLLENGMKLEQVQQFLGHSFIESTEIYTHVSQRQVNEMKWI